MLWIKVDFGNGRIKTAIKEAKAFAVKNGVGVSLNFNDIEVPVAPHSAESDCLEFYRRAIKRPASK